MKNDYAWVYGVLGALFLIGITGGVVNGLTLREVDRRVADERTLAVKDMADALKVVCNEDAETDLAQARACLGGVQVMFQALDIKRQRETADAG